MSKVRVCFLGTPEFAVTCLKALLEDEHYEVVGVVTQPDRPAGRKLSLTPSPVKVLAQKQGLRVLSPESLKENKLILEAIQTWGAEIAVVVAFGQILTEEFMSGFDFGAVNLHASLLPRWRGAAPIQRALQYGDVQGGVCLQKMVKKLDAGDVIGARKISIPVDWNSHQLHDQLAFLGADLLRVELMDYIRGNLTGFKQDESKVTYAKKIEKSESQICWQLPAWMIHNQVRAFTLGPGSVTSFNGKKIKIHSTRIDPNEISIPTENGSVTEISDWAQTQKSYLQTASPESGTILELGDESLTVQCGVGKLQILEVQPESRSRLKIKEFVHGHSLKIGMRLGL